MPADHKLQTTQMHHVFFFANESIGSSEREHVHDFVFFIDKDVVFFYTKQDYYCH